MLVFIQSSRNDARSMGRCLRPESDCERVRYENYYQINHIYDGSEINFKIYLHVSYIMMCVNCGVPRLIRNYAFNLTFSHSTSIFLKMFCLHHQKVSARDRSLPFLPLTRNKRTTFGVIKCLHPHAGTGPPRASRTDRTRRTR